MTVQDSVLERIQNLINQGQHLPDYVERDHERMQGPRSGWITAVLNVVEMICPNPDTAYRARIQKIADRYPMGDVDRIQVSEIWSILEELATDVKSGLVASVADRAATETFDDFLDHAEAYWKDGMKNEAGVVAGVVFEDSVRRVCRKHQIPEKGEKLDQLISILLKKDILTEVKAKRARAAAHVRTKATHAQWDEFAGDDVKATIDFTKEFIRSELDK